MFEELIEHVVAELRKDITRVLSNTRLTGDEKRGRIGELLIGRSMKLILLEFIRRRPTEDPFNFWIRPQFGRNRRNRGVDFKVDIIDAGGQLHIFLVEAKNLQDDYYIGEDYFCDKVLSRFTPFDPEHRWHWMVTLNHEHIDDIGWLCHASGMDIIPMDVVLSQDPDIDELTAGVRAFSTRFIELVQGYVDLPPGMLEEPETTEEFLERGVPDRIVAKYLHKKDAYVSGLRSKMRKKGKVAINRGSGRGRDEREL